MMPSSPEKTTTATIPAPNANGGPPPPPTHDEVVKNPSLFFTTLHSFHSSRGSKFLIPPVIGGKELNLHVLYVEVTKRGGYNKVVMEKKWREISKVLELSPTTTSASYALRKHYLTLLYAYEHHLCYKSQPHSLSHSAEHSFQASGTIHGKFEYGYLVSVQLENDETLTGVLYHPGASMPSPNQLSNAGVPCWKPNQGSRHSRRRKGGDPDRPKPNRSGYNFYFAEKHSSLKSEYPNREREFTKMIGQSWNNLTPQEREVYQEFGVKDKERYQREMKEYKEKQSMKQQNNN
ncbi:high mobility group B protein 9 [Andrographis paniculata]|uniref:high mobility group B protein 9 n=1 Tax=Andrographis paniculata TaxID=175694 RepID=UPI0021E7FB1C|nr:high mobility group B protein 9 [Andrographis paniculata]